MHSLYYHYWSAFAHDKGESQGASALARVGYGEHGLFGISFKEYMANWMCEHREGGIMKVQNSISKAIDTAEQEVQYDNCVKRLLSEKIILAWILKECVDEFNQYPIPQIAKDCIEGKPKIAVAAVDRDELDYSEYLADNQIEGLNTEDSSIKEGKVYFDIRFLAVVPDTEEPVHLIINVEAQKSDKTPYPLIKRAIYYASRMISAQKNKVFAGSHYEKIRKACSIWIQMNVDEEKANTITKYHISEVNVAGTVKEKEKNFDLIAVIMLGLGSAGKAEDKPLLRLLDVLLSAEIKPDEKKAILEKDFGIPMSASMSEEANIMCNLGEGIRERAYAQAAISTQADIIMRIMKNKQVSFEEAFSSIYMPEDEKDNVKAFVDSRLAIK